MLPVILGGAAAFLGYRMWVASKEKKLGPAAPVIASGAAPAKRSLYTPPTSGPAANAPKALLTHYTSVQFDRITEIAKRFGQPIGSPAAVAQWAAKNGPKWASLVGGFTAGTGGTLVLPVPTSNDLGPIDGAKGHAY